MNVPKEDSCQESWLKESRTHQHGRERTDKLIYSPEGNAVFNISISMFSCHFSLLGETFHCSVQLLDGGRQGLNTTGCSTATQMKEEMKQGVLWTAVAIVIELSILFSQAISLAYVLGTPRESSFSLRERLLCHN